MPVCHNNVKKSCYNITTNFSSYNMIHVNIIWCVVIDSIIKNIDSNTKYSDPQHYTKNSKIRQQWQENVIKVLKVNVANVILN